MKIGMVGTGGFSRKHANIFTGMECISLQAVCGTSLAKAEAFAKPYGEANAYDKLSHMLDREKLDAVYLCVPPFAHGAAELQLIERGIPFFVEKPLAVNMDVPDRVRGALQQKKVITSAGYHFRYRDAVAEVKKSLENVKVGMAAGAWMGSMPLVPWWRGKHTSGGQFVEQTTHLIDLIRYTLGEVREVYAVEANRLMAEKLDGVTVADVGSAVLKMKSGTVVQLANTCMLPDGVSQIELQYFHSGGITKIDQAGVTISEPARQETKTDTANPYVLENHAFLQAVRTGDTSGILSDYEDACRTQKVAHAILTSAGSNQPVQVGGNQS